MHLSCLRGSTFRENPRKKSILVTINLYMYWDFQRVSFLFSFYFFSFLFFPFLFSFWYFWTLGLLSCRSRSVHYSAQASFVQSSQTWIFFNSSVELYCQICSSLENRSSCVHVFFSVWTRAYTYFGHGAVSPQSTLLVFRQLDNYCKAVWQL